MAEYKKQQQKDKKTEKIIIPIEEDDSEEINEQSKEDATQQADATEQADAIDPETLHGTSLNFFSRNLTNADPVLFNTKADAKFNSYSRSCPSNAKRQPVILTQKEKDKIDKLYPGSYTDAIQYGTAADNKHWYICPRYWCLLDNRPLTEQQVKAGECGGKVISHGDKKIPKGKYIYEFYR